MSTTPLGRGVREQHRLLARDINCNLDVRLHTRAMLVSIVEFRS